MIFEKFGYFAADELFPVITHNFGWHPESTYDVIPNEVDGFLLPDFLEGLCFNPLRKIVSHK